MSKELIQRAEQIQNEVRVGANTAKRVGGFLADMAREVNGLYDNVLDWINNEKPQGSGYILTQSDVVNNLTDESELKPLSAKQGMVLKGMIENGGNGSKLYSFSTPLLLESNRTESLVLNDADTALIGLLNDSNNGLIGSEINYCGKDSSGNQSVVPLNFYADLYGGEFRAYVSYTTETGLIFKFEITGDPGDSVYTATPLTKVSDGVEFLTTPYLLDPDRTNAIQLSNRDVGILVSYFKGNKKPLFYASSINGGNEINTPLTIVGDFGANPDDGVAFAIGYTIYSDGGFCISPTMPGEYYIRMNIPDGTSVTAYIPNKTQGGGSGGEAHESKTFQLNTNLSSKTFYTTTLDNSICNPGNIVLIKGYLRWSVNGERYGCNVSTVCHVSGNSSPGTATLATCSLSGGYSDASINVAVQPQRIEFSIIIGSTITSMDTSSVKVFKL